MGFGFSRIMGKKIIRGIILSLLFVSAFIMIFGLSFRLAAFDEGFYKKEFAKYGVYENLQGHDVKSINKGVLDYLLKEDGNIIAGSFFNEREKGHLLDVRIIIRKFLFVYHASIFFFFALIFILLALTSYGIKKFLSLISKIILSAALSTMLLALALFFASFTGFETIFQKFHETFFLPETFLFDPNFEKIVVLYPENIFFDLLARIILFAVLSSVIAGGVCAGFLGKDFFKKLLKKIRRKTK